MRGVPKLLLQCILRSGDPTLAEAPVLSKAWRTKSSAIEPKAEEMKTKLQKSEPKLNNDWSPAFRKRA